MAAKAQIKVRPQEVPGTEKRRAMRRVSGSRVVVKSSSGEKARASIEDVSIYGCGLESDAPWMRTGSFVALDVSSERSIQAIVRWWRDGKGGVEFLRPISASEAEELSGD